MTEIHRNFTNVLDMRIALFITCAVSETILSDQFGLQDLKNVSFTLPRSLKEEAFSRRFSSSFIHELFVVKLSRE